MINDPRSELDRLLESVVDRPDCPPDIYHAILDWFERDPDDEAIRIADARHLLESKGWKLYEPRKED